jgi:hypothetical protein
MLHPAERTGSVAVGAARSSSRYRLTRPALSATTAPRPRTPRYSRACLRAAALLVALQCLVASAALAQQFKVLRGTVTMGSGSGAVGDSTTITEGTHYDLDALATITNSFIRITNASYTSNGTTTGADLADQGAHVAYIANPENLLSSITFTRGRTGTTGEANIVVAYEIIQYLGPAGGADEIIVRKVEQKNTASGGTSADGATITNIADIGKGMAVLTSQAHSDSTDDHSNAGLFTLELVPSGANWFVRGTRGDDEDIGRFSYAVVEFSGYQWRNVQRIAISPWSTAWNGADFWTATTNGDSETAAISALGGVALLNASKAFSHGQYRYVNTAGLTHEARMSQTYEVSGADQLRRRFGVDAQNMSLRHTVLWIVESGAPTMLVQRQNNYLASASNANAQTTTTYTLGTAVTAADRASVWGEQSSSLQTGGGKLPYRAINVRLASANTVEVTIGRQDAGNRRGFEVVEWPAGPAGPPPTPTATPTPTPTSTPLPPTPTPTPTPTMPPPTPTPTPILSSLTIRTEGTASGGYVYVELYLDGAAALTGLSLRLHFDASQLTFDAVEQIIQNSVATQTLADGEDFDGDASTSSYCNFGWSDSSQSWPGSGSSHLLTRVRFISVGTPETTLRITMDEMPPGYAISAPSFDIPDDLN